MILAVLAGIFIQGKTQNGIAGLVVGVILSALGFGIGYAQLMKLRAQTKSMLMNNICTFLGWQYTEKEFESPNMDIWRKNRLMPSYDRSSFEDQMTGTAHGTRFKFCEAHLERESRDSDGKRHWSTVFRGVLLEIEFPEKFLGKTVVLRDAGIFNRKKFSDMKRVGLVDPKFEKIFEAYGTDQVEARVLLTPTFMQRLVDLEQKFDGKKSRFGFIDRKLYIGIEAPNQFEAGSMMKPLTDSSRTQKILNELGSIMDVIDGVMKPLEQARFGK
ncbi:MAG TPA: DUF3137 domain-containing protein [Hellea balneolensis]|uniref:DUF3137 domain-containing protein n=1 Tax=Hellea balneolensis TaxID=287478 RepID=A0A7C5LVD8_9PROT|nr:DUF3137 domain-containing protein [Hellea balneolensis]